MTRHEKINFRPCVPIQCVTGKRHTPPCSRAHSLSFTLFSIRFSFWRVAIMFASLTCVREAHECTIIFQAYSLIFSAKRTGAAAVASMSDIASSLVSRLQSIVGTSSGANDASSSENGNSAARNGRPPILSTQADTKRVAKLAKATKSLLALCLQKGMNLKTSPPFIVQLLNETKEYLFMVLVRTPNILENNAYLQLFITNYLSKCREVSTCFDEVFVLGFAHFRQRKYSPITARTCSKRRAKVAML